MTIPLPLLDRFREFMGTYPRAENIDSLVPKGGGVGVQRADYFLNDRSVILELKSLETDLRPKLDGITEELSQRPDWPVFYGTVELWKLADRLDDGEAVKSEVFVKLSRSVEHAFKKADKQIAQTRDLFCLPKSVPGVLLILNEQVEDLEPRVIGHRVRQLLFEQDTYGSRRYSNVELVIAVCETHRAASDRAQETIPLLIVESPTAEYYPRLSAIADDLLRDWAAFNGGLLRETEDAAGDLSNLQSKTAWDLDHATKLPRHELWRREYRRRPYLGSLADEAVLEHGSRIAQTMMPHFLKGGSRLPEATVQELIIGWTHFLEEAAHRGLDFRAMRSI